MSLHNGVDLVSYVSIGVLSKTYGAGEEENIAALYASLGHLEAAPEATGTVGRIINWLFGFF